MGKRTSVGGIAHIGRRRSAVVLVLLAGLLVAGCAQRDGGADDNRPGGFYGGVSGGMTHP